MRESSWPAAALLSSEDPWLALLLAALALSSKTMAHMWAPAEWPRADTCRDSKAHEEGARQPQGSWLHVLFYASADLD